MAWIAIGVGGGVALTAYAALTAAMVRVAAIGLGLLTGGFAVLVLSEMVKDAEDAADWCGSHGGRGSRSRIRRDGGCRLPARTEMPKCTQRVTRARRRRDPTDQTVLSQPEA